MRIANLKLLDNVDKNRVAEVNHGLFDEINYCYKAFATWINSDPKNACYSKQILVFSFNLFDIGLVDEALTMLNLVKPGYYEKDLMKDFDFAIESWNKAEGLNNQVDPELKAQRQKHYQEAEFAIVVMGMTLVLDRLKDFCGKDDFLKFRKQIVDKGSFLIKLTPKIGIVNENDSELGNNGKERK